MGGSWIMIRYRKTIQIKTTRNGDIEIATDVGQTWRTLRIVSSSPVTEWLSRSSQNTLAHWQKDMIKVVLDAYSHTIPEHGQAFELYQVYKKGQGYTSTSDVMLMRIPQYNVWFFSTSENTWLFEQKLENFSMTIDQSVGSILDKTVREQIYVWSDTQRGIKPSRIKYSDQDYQAKGLAQ